MKNSADKSVNRLYGGIRSQYNDARANGYRLHNYFLREQEILIDTIGKKPGIVLDIACGSGLMTLPLVDNATMLLGIDFNEDACISAKSNSLNIMRGNAFSMPLQDNSVNNACCCQFLNQQPKENASLLLSECYRVLSSEGKIILIWRNGDAIIHKIAHAVFQLFDLIKGRPSFPMVNHPISHIEKVAHSAGFETIRKETIFPLLRWHTDKINSLISKLIGASFFLVLKRH